MLFRSLLSKKKLEASEHWDEINNALEENTLIDVEVVRKVNGGVIAAYKEVQGFIPLSQLSDRFVEDASEFVGQTLTVRVTRVDPRRNKAVFSHKAFLNEKRQKALEKVWANIYVDDIEADHSPGQGRGDHRHRHHPDLLPGPEHLRDGRLRLRDAAPSLPADGLPQQGPAHHAHQREIGRAHV